MSGNPRGTLCKAFLLFPGAIPIEFTSLRWIRKGLSGASGRTGIPYGMGLTWSEWEELGRPAGGALSQITAVRYSNRMDVFGIDYKNNVLVNKFWSGQSWSNWQDLGRPAAGPTGAKFTSGPIALWSQREGQGPRLDVFVRDQSLAIAHKWRGDSWSNWEDLGKPAAAGLYVPAAVSWGTNRIDVFAPSQEKGVLMHKWWDGSSWSEWEELGRPAAGRLANVAAVSWGFKRIDVFSVTGINTNVLVHKWWDGSSWSNWEELGTTGGRMPWRPAVVSWGAKRIDVFTLGQNDFLVHKWWDGSWSNWEDTRAGIAGDLIAVSWGANRIDVFWIQNYAIQHQWWS